MTPLNPIERLVILLRATIAEAEQDTMQRRPMNMHERLAWYRKKAEEIAAEVRRSDDRLTERDLLDWIGPGKRYASAEDMARDAMRWHDEAQAEKMRDEARGTLASLTDRLNVWLRENGLREVGSPYDSGDLRDGIDRLALCLASWRSRSRMDG